MHLAISNDLHYKSIYVKICGMAKGKKTGGRNYPKGVSGNPSGRIKLPPEVAEAKRMTSVTFIESACRIGAMKYGEMTAMLQNNETSVADKALCACWARVILKGDMLAYDILLNRIMGKPADNVNLNTKTPVINFMPAPINAALDAVKAEFLADAAGSAEKPTENGQGGDKPAESM